MGRKRRDERVTMAGDERMSWFARDLERVLDALDPQPDALLRLLAPEIDDSMLEEIAGADHGVDFEEHLAALRRIRDEGHVFEPTGMVPGEVLEIIAIRDIDSGWDPRSPRPRAHAIRLFACAAIARAAGAPENRDRFLAEDRAALHLAASAIVLGREHAVAALRSLAWRLAVLSRDGDSDPRLVSLLLTLLVVLAASSWWPGDDSRSIIDLAACLDGGVETRITDDLLIGMVRTSWIEPERRLPPEAADRMRALGERLLR